VALRPEDLHATRIAAGGCDLVLGSDIVVTSGADALLRMGKGRTAAIVNRHVAPTAEFASRPDLDLSPDAMEQSIRAAAGDDGCHFLDATEIATALLGDAIGTNLFLVGYALQRGLLPVSLAALERAIELNGRAVAMNQRALSWGRLAAVDRAAVERAARPSRRSDVAAAPPSLEDLVAKRVAFLTAYQNAAYAERYRARVLAVATRERERCGPGATPLASAAARYYFKLLAYKDEYEVARLWTDGSFRAQLDREFSGWKRVELQLAPQLLNPRDPDTGRAKKRTLGPWVFAGLRVMATLKFLRGTPFDPFGWTAHRRRERALIGEYEATLDALLVGLAPDNRDLAIEIASLPEGIRGYDLVKDRHLADVESKQRELMDAFRLRA
jgi:indolepyruvate ferredoxin oxidoreductase